MMRFLACMAFVSLTASAQTPVPPWWQEDFEAIPLGGIPKGVTKDGAVRVVDDVAHTGQKSLRLDAALKGPRRITRTGPEVAALGGEHWGRLYFKVAQPLPTLPDPPEGRKVSSVHITFVSGKALSPQFDDPIETRLMGVSFNGASDVQYLYNVQTAKRGEFGLSTKPRFRFVTEWTLAEWHVSHATQTYQFFLNGEEVKELTFTKGAGKFERSEIPASFQTLSVGFLNYQPTLAPGFTVWIDDLAVATNRLGPVAVPKPKAK